METRLHGAPYGDRGERGNDVTTINEATEYAESQLSYGQSMHAIDGDNHVATYYCGNAGVERSY